MAIDRQRILDRACGLALSSRRILVLRCEQAAGAEGRALADALMDMMLAGAFPVGWPIAEALSLLDAGGPSRCARTRRLRSELARLHEDILDQQLVSAQVDDEQNDVELAA
jgi:hypothetical protein